MRIAVFNVKYSPNLGDGIIAECLEAVLRARPGTEVTALDLAGRQRFGEGLGEGADRGEGRGGGTLRARLLDALAAWPGPARRTAVRVLLGGLLRLRLRPRWRQALRECDAAIVGGGQLIADADLNFPLKLAAAADECGKRSLPVAVLAVGVAPDWSRPGRALLRRLFSRDVVQVAVRDERSRDALRRLLGEAARDGCAPLTCRDPGLLAAEVYPAPDRPRRTRPLVGVGVTHPSVLRAHADAPGRLPACDEAAYAALIGALLRAGCDVACFTNGAAEDEAHLAALRGRLADTPGTAGRVAFLDRPRHPADLAAAVAGLDALVGHRLHAHIVAYAYGVPSVGLHWDGKVPAFMASVGREAFMATLGATPVEGIALQVVAALRVGIDGGTRQAVVRDARRGIERALDALEVACALRSLAARPAASSAATPLARAVTTAGGGAAA